MSFEYFIIYNYDFRYTNHRHFYIHIISERELLPFLKTCLKIMLKRGRIFEKKKNLTSISLYIIVCVLEYVAQRVDQLRESNIVNDHV